MEVTLKHVIFAVSVAVGAEVARGAGFEEGEVGRAAVDALPSMRARLALKPACGVGPCTFEAATIVTVGEPADAAAWTCCGATAGRGIECAEECDVVGRWDDWGRWRWGRWCGWR